MAISRERRAKLERKIRHLPSSYDGRRRTLIALFAIAACALVYRSVDRQIFEKDFLQSEGNERHLSVVQIQAHRGVITDRNGAVLAMSTPVDSIAANPRQLKADMPGMPALAKALDISLDDLRQKLARNSEKQFVYLKRRMPPDQAAKILASANEQNLKGLFIEREYRRYYPTGEIFSHLIGFTDIEDHGQEGLELAYDQSLSGSDGSKRVLRDGRRQAVKDVENIRMPRTGDNLALSLDQRLQFIAYRELKSAITEYEAQSGSVVMLDARTGEVLAMVNQPGYNSNGDRSNIGGRLRNRALTDLFEPGSTMKPFTVASALEFGDIKPDWKVDTGTGAFYVGAHQVKDHHPLGIIDLQTLIQKSSNVGAARLALSLDSEKFYNTLSSLGFGQNPATGYPGEESGVLRPAKSWARIDQATLSFGYGLSVTALQLAQAYSVLAADGIKRPVTILRRDQVPEGERVFSVQTARTLREMMESVVERGGTATKASLAGYRVSGKTGTVKKAEGGSYADNDYIGLFAGMAPASRPRLVVVVMINQPAGKYYYGGDVAAPVFSRIMDDALRLLNVPPDDLQGTGMQLAEAKGHKP